MLKLLSFICLLNSSLLLAKQEDKKGGFLGFINFITKRIPIIGFSIIDPIQISDKNLSRTLGRIQKLANSKPNVKYPLDSFLTDLSRSGNDFYVVQAPGFDFRRSHGKSTLDIESGSVLFNEFSLPLDFKNESHSQQFSSDNFDPNKPHLKFQSKTLMIVHMQGNSLVIDFSVVDGKSKGITKALKGLNLSGRRKCVDGLDYCLVTSRESFPQLIIPDLLQTSSSSVAPKLTDDNILKASSPQDLNRMAEDSSQADNECREKIASKSKTGSGPSDIMTLVNSLLKIIANFLVMDLLDFLVNPEINIKKIVIPDIKNLNNQYMEVELVISARHLRLTMVKPSILLCLGDIFDNR